MADQEEDVTPDEVLAEVPEDTGSAPTAPEPPASASPPESMDEDDDDDDDDGEQGVDPVSSEPAATQSADASKADLNPQQVDAPPPLPPNDPALMAQHQGLYAQDLSSGKITPKTYKDLMGHGAFGKVGSLFGLILSGMGSGLAHQPNMVMQMMDNEISRDLDAQKATKSNQMNLYSLALQHQRNQTEIARAYYQNKLDQARIDRNPTEMAINQKRLEGLDVTNKLNATNLGMATARLNIMHDLAQTGDRMAEGPQKAAYTTALNGVTQAGLQGNAKGNQETAQKVGLVHSMLGLNASETEQQFQQRQMQLNSVGMGEMAKAEQAKHLVGVPGRSSIDLTSEDRVQHMTSQNLIGSLQRLKEFSEAHPNPPVGSAADATGKALAAQVQGDFRMATHGGVFKEGEQNFINRIIPGDPTTWNPFAQVGAKIDAVMKETKARDDLFLKSKGFPVTGGESRKEGSSSLEKPEQPKVMIDKSGKKWLVDPRTKKVLGPK